MTETNEFRVPDSGILIKLIQVTNIHGQEGKMLTVQVQLVQPRQDILSVRVRTDGRHDSDPVSLCHVSSDSKSLILELRPRRKIDLDGDGSVYRSYVFHLEVLNNPWSESYERIDVAKPDIVILSAGGVQLPTLRQHLLKSPVLKEKLALAGNDCQAIDLSSFSLQVVQEAIRFLMHGYCCLWDSAERDNLLRIATDLGIQEMKTLAEQKLKLLQP